MIYSAQTFSEQILVLNFGLLKKLPIKCIYLFCTYCVFKTCTECVCINHVNQVFLLSTRVQTCCRLTVCRHCLHIMCIFTVHILCIFNMYILCVYVLWLACTITYFWPLGHVANNHQRGCVTESAQYLMLLWNKKKKNSLLVNIKNSILFMSEKSQCHIRIQHCFTEVNCGINAFSQELNIIHNHCAWSDHTDIIYAVESMPALPCWGPLWAKELE